MSDSRIPKELHGKIFELTLAIYRVTDFFPQGEVLRKNLRQKANEIFGGVSEYGYEADFERSAIGILGRIEAIKGYLGIARSMRFVKPINITILDREYNFLANYFSRELQTIPKPFGPGSQPTEVGLGMAKRAEPPEEPVDKNANDRPVLAESLEKLSTWEDFATEDKPENGSLNDRQKKIVSFMTSSPQVKISDFYTMFNGISSKTIQRDLQDLVFRNVLKKEGDKRWTVYSLNGIGHNGHSE